MSKYETEDKITELITQKELEDRIKELGEEISRNHAGHSVHLICILKGGVYFMTERSKYITVPVTLGFM